MTQTLRHLEGFTRSSIGRTLPVRAAQFAVEALSIEGGRCSPEWVAKRIGPPRAHSVEFAQMPFRERFA